MSRFASSTSTTSAAQLPRGFASTKKLRESKNLGTILSHKRNKHKAHRALKKKEYETLLRCDCPRMVRYTPSKEIAGAVVKYVTKSLPRLKAKHLAWELYNRMHTLPLRIGVESPNPCHRGNHKMDWYEMGIRDKHIRDELAKYLLKEGYTHRVGTNKIRSKKYKFRTIFIQSH